MRDLAGAVGLIVNIAFVEAVIHVLLDGIFQSFVAIADIDDIRIAFATYLAISDVDDRHAEGSGLANS